MRIGPIRRRALSAEPHFAGQRTHDFVNAHAWPGIARARDPPRGRAQPRNRRRRRRAHLQRTEVHCEASVTPEVRSGTISLPKGLWARSTFNGTTGTALVPDTLSDLGGGACFNDARVQIELLARH